MKVLIALLSLYAPAHAGTAFSGDLQITGQIGIQTQVPKARLEAQMAPADEYGLKVSSSNGTPLFVLDRTGRAGVGTVYPQARLDVAGSGDDGSVGIWLRGGNSTGSVAGAQIVFGLASTDTYRHSIRTRHTFSENRLNSIDFFLWNSTNSPSTLGSLNVLSIEGIPAASSVSVHVMPAGSPDVELEVSDGITTGGGTIHRAAASTHSSKALKSDISYLSDADIQRAYEDVKALKHARFRYKPARPGGAPGRTLRGLIYEDVPESVRGPGETVVFDNRLANLEMALKVVNGKIEALEKKIAEEKRRR